MNFATRKAGNAAAQRRLDSNADRSKARSLRSAFPEVELIQIDLTFSGYEPAPSPQAHSLYPAAQAYFRFSCPCMDCDGELDLTSYVSKLAAGGKGKSRSADGHSRCQGVHWRDSGRSVECGMETRFKIQVKTTA